MRCKTKPIIFLIFFLLVSSFFSLSFASPIVRLPITTGVPANQKTNFGEYWVNSTGSNMHIIAWFNTNWLNYTVDSASTQQIYNGTKPTRVYVNGVLGVESIDWNYSVGTTTVYSSLNASLQWDIGQNLAFILGESILIFAHNLIGKELMFQPTNTIMPSAANYFWKAIGFQTDGTISLTSINLFNKALNFLTSGTVNLWDSGTAVFQITGARAYTFILDGLIKLWDSGGMNKALQFTNTGTVRFWDSAAMLKAVILKAFENFDAVNIYAYPTANFPIAALTLDTAVAIAVLALVLAITGISMVFLRKRRN